MFACTYQTDPAITLVSPNADTHKRHLQLLIDNTRKAWVGQEDIWDERKLDKFFDNCAKEEAQSDDERTSYFYAIERSNRCIGIIGIHLSSYLIRNEFRYIVTMCYFTTTLTQIGIQILDMALTQFWKHNPSETVYMDVPVKNSTMSLIAKRLGFQQGYQHKYNQILYTRFTNRRR